MPMSLEVMRTIHIPLSIIDWLSHHQGCIALDCVPHSLFYFLEQNPFPIFTPCNTASWQNREADRLVRCLPPIAAWQVVSRVWSWGCTAKSIQMTCNRSNGHFNLLLWVRQPIQTPKLDIKQYKRQFFIEILILKTKNAIFVSSICIYK